MTLGEPGRQRAAPSGSLEGSEHVVEADTAILALGYWPDPLLGETTGPRDARLGTDEPIPCRAHKPAQRLGGGR